MRFGRRLYEICFPGSGIFIQGRRKVPFWQGTLDFPKFRKGRLIGQIPFPKGAFGVGKGLWINLKGGLGHFTSFGVKTGFQRALGKTI